MPGTLSIEQRLRIYTGNTPADIQQAVNADLALTVVHRQDGHQRSRRGAGRMGLVGTTDTSVNTKTEES